MKKNQDKTFRVHLKICLKRLQKNTLRFRPAFVTTTRFFFGCQGKSPSAKIGTWSWQESKSKFFNTKTVQNFTSMAGCWQRLQVWPKETKKLFTVAWTLALPSSSSTLNFQLLSFDINLFLLNRIYWTHCCLWWPGVLLQKTSQKLKKGLRKEETTKKMKKKPYLGLVGYLSE